MSEPNERVEALLQFNPLSKADKEYLESALIEEIGVCEHEKRVGDAIRLRRKLAELRGVKLPPEPPKTQEQAALEREIAQAEREGDVRRAISLKRRRAGL